MDFLDLDAAIQDRDARPAPGDDPELDLAAGDVLEGVRRGVPGLLALPDRVGDDRPALVQVFLDGGLAPGQRAVREAAAAGALGEVFDDDAEVGLAEGGLGGVAACVVRAGVIAGPCVVRAGVRVFGFPEVADLDNDRSAAGGAGSLAGAIGERPAFEAGEEAELAVRKMLDLLAALPGELLLCFMAMHRGRTLRQAVEIAARQTGRSGRTLWRSLALLRRNGAPAAALFGPAEAGPENGERRTENRARGKRAMGEPEQLEFAL